MNLANVLMKDMKKDNVIFSIITLIFPIWALLVLFLGSGQRKEENSGLHGGRIGQGDLCHLQQDKYCHVLIVGSMTF